ncbi:hypothetical protein FFI16_010555 [Pseudomonas sp. KBS0710]|nr:hypothetical protein FFI16_010555 [Pseudomonas sp. KBS0710]
MVRLSSRKSLLPGLTGERNGVRPLFFWRSIKRGLTPIFPFSMDRKEILGAVDEAWLKKGSPVSSDPGAYVVPMGRAIGTSGETSIKIIVLPGTNKVITAYPVN